MSGQLYNLIMASVPGFYSGDQGEFNIPLSRFLEYTEDPVRGQFQTLDHDAINKLKSLSAELKQLQSAGSRFPSSLERVIKFKHFAVFASKASLDDKTTQKSAPWDPQSL